MKLYRVMALLLKYYYITTNRLDRLFDIVYWPSIDIFVWGFATFFFESLSDVNLLSMLIGGVILWSFVWRASQDIAVYILEDFWSRNLYNLFTSPVKSIEIIISVIIFSVLRSFASFMVMVLLAFILYSFNFFSIGIFYISIFVPLLMLVGWVMGLLVTSIIYRYGTRIQVLAWSVVWVIQPFSCVFYPLSALPPWAQKIAILMPTTYVFEGLRAVLNNTKIPWYGITYSFTITIILLIIVSLFLKSSIDHARKTGLFARYD